MTATGNPHMNDDISAYERQGFGAAMAPKAPTVC